MKDSRLSLKTLPAFPIWAALFSGADGENPDGGGQGSTGESGGAAGTGTNGSGEGGEGSQNGEPDPANKKIQVLTEEKDRHFNLRKQAERERDDALRRLKDIEDKGKDETTKTAERLEELESTVTSLREQNQRLAVENAFLKENTYAWQSPEVALRLADLSTVEIDKDGKVVGLKAALDRLAKENPFLLKPKEEPPGGGQKPPQSGDPVGSRRGASGGDAADKERLRQKYPALRR